MKNQPVSDFPQKFPVGPDPLSEEKLQRIIGEELTEWKLVTSPLPENPFIARTELYREYRFEDFDKVIEYITKIAVACNIFPHHPRWENTWTTLRVWLTTWDIKHIISYKDIMLARHMETLYESYSKSPDNPHTSSRVGNEKKEFLSSIRELVRKDEVEKAFDRITEYTALNREKDISDELTLLTSRFHRIQKEKRLARIDWKEAEPEINQILGSLLGMLDRL